MTISSAQKIDFLWKKLIYGVSKSDLDTSKSGSNETIASPLPVYASNIWTQTTTAYIPATPPGSSTSYVQVYTGSNRVAASADITAGTPAARPTWSTGVTNWIPPTFGSAYAVSVYVGDPLTTGIQIFPDATGNEWVFDYQAGVLNFPTAPPTGNAQWANGIYIVGYVYIGAKGAGPTGPTGGAGPTGPTGTGPTGPTGPGGGGSSLVLYNEHSTTYTPPSAAGANSIALGDSAYAYLSGGITQANGSFAAAGDAQASVYMLRNTTSSTVLTELYLDASSDRMLIPSNTTWSFYIMVAGHCVGSSLSGAFEYRGALRKDATSASLRLLNLNKTTIAKDDLAWDTDVTLDTLNGVLRLRAKGNTGQTVRWVAKISTVEVGG